MTRTKRPPDDTRRLALRNVKRAHREREKAADAYKVSIDRARGAGCTLAEIADTVGTDKATISKMHKRFRVAADDLSG